MKKFYTNIIAGILLTTGVAVNAEPLLTELPLDHVTLQLSAERWAKTTSAKVTVSVEATLTKENLAVLREQIMGNLNKIAAGDWHITQFDRTLDSSGLEKLSALAEARIDEKSLSNINAQALAVTKPGATYKVQNVEFAPSLAELEAVKAAVRADIYRQATNEIATLNKLYPEQKYTLHNLNFLGFVIQPGPQPRMSSEMNTMVMTAGSSKMAASSLSVSDQIQLTATVDIAATRDLKGKV